MFKKMPFILLGIIAAATFVHSWIPTTVIATLYGLSLSIKSLILFVLPVVIFGLLFKTTVQLSKSASKTILLLIGAICLSNFVCTWIGFSVGSLAYHLDLSMSLPPAEHALQPLWEMKFPKWIGNAQALFSALLLGVILGKFKPEMAERWATRFEKLISWILKGLLILVPLFIAGFVLKMNHDKVMSIILRNYALIFAIVAGAIYSYIIFLYLLANRFQIRPTLQSLKNMVPAMITGFGSMSSAAAMPLTLMGTEKNAENKDLAKAIIPATVNIHLIGDCFAIPIFAFAILKSFGLADPSVSTYLFFALSFVLAKFSVAAVPGGGVLVMLPILESYLGLNSEMLSLITALYFLLDPVVTSANVLGNGGFAMLMSKILKKKSLPEKETIS